MRERFGRTGQSRNQRAVGSTESQCAAQLRQCSATEERPPFKLQTAVDRSGERTEPSECILEGLTVAPLVMFFDNAECDTPLNGRLSVAHSYLRAGMIHPQCAACAQSAPTGNNDHRERKHRKHDQSLPCESHALRTSSNTPQRAHGLGCATVRWAQPCHVTASALQLLGDCEPLGLGLALAYRMQPSDQMSHLLL